MSQLRFFFFFLKKQVDCKQAVLYAKAKADLEQKKEAGTKQYPSLFFAKNNQIIACNFYGINAFQKSDSSM